MILNTHELLCKLVIICYTANKFIHPEVVMDELLLGTTVKTEIRIFIAIVFWYFSQKNFSRFNYLVE